MESLRELYRIGRGPSSSHTMGPSHAAVLFRRAFPQAERFQAVLYGSLAKTGKGHLTDVAIQDTFAPLPTEILWERETPEESLPHPQHHGAAGLPGGGAAGAGGGCSAWAAAKLR